MIHVPTLDNDWFSKKYITMTCSTVAICLPVFDAVGCYEYLLDSQDIKNHSRSTEFFLRIMKLTAHIII